MNEERRVHSSRRPKKVPPPNCLSCSRAADRRSSALPQQNAKQSATSLMSTLLSRHSPSRRSGRRIGMDLQLLSNHACTAYAACMGKTRHSQRWDPPISKDQMPLNLDAVNTPHTKRATTPPYHPSNQSHARLALDAREFLLSLSTRILTSHEHESPHFL